MGWGIPLDIYADFNRLNGDTVKFWIDTDADVVLDGNEIVSMADQSNFGNNASQSSSVNRPELVVFNGENVIQLDSNTRLNADGVSSVFNAQDVPYTVFDLYEPDTLLGARKCLSGSGLASDINKFYFSGFISDGSRESERKDGVTSSIATGTTDISIPSRLKVLTERCDGKNVAYWRDGIPDSGGGLPDAFANPLNTQDKYTIGALRRGGMAATNHCRGKLKAKLVCDRNISDPERVWVQNAFDERRFSWTV